ncbi:MAG: PspC domain-containing protein [Verrucomicrobia bacterium]|nr:PspC domain-containing protein [Verrucomicrobiota bacterium]
MDNLSTIKIARAGTVIGEFLAHEIGAKLRDGSLRPTDHYWKKGMSGWSLLGQASAWEQPVQAHEPPPIPANIPTQSTPTPAAAPAYPQSHRTIHGRVLGYTFQTSSGFISGNDGVRYAFTAADWLSSDKTPAPGLEVEFLTNGAQAKSIFVVFSAATPPATTSSVPSDHYRSSDDALVSGVCAGLAHKWKTDTLLIRIVMLFVPLGWILYLIASMSWAAKPTKGR